jgi:hypothetical protein
MRIGQIGGRPETFRSLKYNKFNCWKVWRRGGSDHYIELQNIFDDYTRIGSMNYWYWSKYKRIF